jgi:tetratricopeptide (TPR) repeat protein
MGIHKDDVGKLKSLSILQHWTETAELCVEAGKFQEAFESLMDVKEAIYASDAPGEFARVGKTLFRSIDWKLHANYKNFDAVFNTYFHILVNLGRDSDYQDAIEHYAATVPVKDARYVNYCDLRCYMHWVRLEYAKAIEWGQIGKDLKDKSKVDTRWSTDHHLALAQRDAGIIDPALKYFLQTAKLETVIDPDEFDNERGASFYGNIGRCLHLMGQIDPAIICYRKSAILLQGDEDQHVENQGFIRRWIGELLLAKGEFC